MRMSYRKDVTTITDYRVGTHTYIIIHTRSLHIHM